MTLEERYEKVVNLCATLNSENSTIKGQRQVYISNLKDLGLKSLDDAETFLKNSEKEQEELLKKLNPMLETMEKELGIKVEQEEDFL